MKPAEKELLKQQVNFQPLGPWTRSTMVSGLQLPTGQIVMNMSERTSGATLALYKHQLQANYVLIKGLWTFQPDINDLKIYENPGDFEGNG